MKQLNLTNKQINEIFDKAVRKYSYDNASRERNFLCECVIEAFLDFCAYNKYVVKDGKIYLDDRTK